ncbi:MAG: tetraacyldisaccharide 4'-kinase [Rhizobiaceae bacterium]
MQQPAAAQTKSPVCGVGNLIAGGAGKTPTAVAIARIARNMGLRPGFLSRGYGGNTTEPTLVNIKSHNAGDVGDEPLILALYADTVVSADRPAGAELLEQQGVDLVIMDDGFQNPSLKKDFSLVVVDAGRGIGNGFCIPAGPLRAPLQNQLSRADAVLLIGQSAAGMEVVRKCARAAKPVFASTIQARKPEEWLDVDVLAYSGIAVPQKFFDSLSDVGANVVETQSFPDHHPFTGDECRELMALAAKKQLVLATTEKDAARLVRAGPEQQLLRKASRTLYVDLQFDNPRLIEMAIQDAIDAASARRLKTRT